MPIGARASRLKNLSSGKRGEIAGTCLAKGKLAGKSARPHSFARKDELSFATFRRAFDELSRAAPAEGNLEGCGPGCGPSQPPVDRCQRRFTATTERKPSRSRRNLSAKIKD